MNKRKATAGTSVAEADLRPKSTRRRRPRALIDDEPSYDGASAGLARRVGSGDDDGGSAAQQTPSGSSDDEEDAEDASSSGSDGGISNSEAEGEKQPAGGGGSSSSSSSSSSSNTREPAAKRSGSSKVVSSKGKGRGKGKGNKEKEAKEAKQEMLGKTELIIQLGTNIVEGAAHKTSKSGLRGQFMEVAGEFKCNMTHEDLLALLVSEDYPAKHEPLNGFTHTCDATKIIVIASRGGADQAIDDSNGAPWDRLLLGRAMKSRGNPVEIAIQAKYDAGTLGSSGKHRPSSAAASPATGGRGPLKRIVYKCLSKPIMIQHGDKNSEPFAPSSPIYTRDAGIFTDFSVVLNASATGELKCEGQDELSCGSVSAPSCELLEHLRSLVVTHCRENIDTTVDSLPLARIPSKTGFPSSTTRAELTPIFHPAMLFNESCMFVDKSGSNGLVHIGMRVCPAAPGLPMVYHASEFTGMVLKGFFPTYAPPHEASAQKLKRDHAGAVQDIERTHNSMVTIITSQMWYQYQLTPQMKAEWVAQLVSGHLDAVPLETIQQERDSTAHDQRVKDGRCEPDWAGLPTEHNLYAHVQEQLADGKPRAKASATGKPPSDIVQLGTVLGSAITSLATSLGSGGGGSAAAAPTHNAPAADAPASLMQTLMPHLAKDAAAAAFKKAALGDSATNGLWACSGSDIEKFLENFALIYPPAQW